MPLFAPFQSLRDIASKLDRNRLVALAAKAEGKSIFLSHSSADHDLLPAVIEILQKHGGTVYVDDLDPHVGGKDVLSTAQRIRSVLQSTKKFILFVTPNTKDSKWIPWELGLGDGNLSTGSVALFPAAESSADQQWSEQEYLGLYQRIVWGRLQYEEDHFQWLVWNFRENTAEKLRTWITRN